MTILPFGPWIGRLLGRPTGALPVKPVEGAWRPRLPDGERIYAVGDVHGRLDLLEAILAAIDLDEADRQPARTRVVLLGDIVDRGPDVASVMRRVHGLDPDRFILIKGNHEAVLAEVLAGQVSRVQLWLDHGGAQTLESWGVDPEIVAIGDPGPLIAAARAVIPPQLVTWLANLPLSYRAGDYLFVHAGIDADRPLDEQRAEHLLWARSDFLADPRRHPAMIVHGHSICATPELPGNRIGIDTGAYLTGRLTALGLQGEEQWLLST